MTELRYLPDADGVTEFSATVTAVDDDGEYLILDGTYFYPEGGGQPADHGTLAWDGGSAEVVDAYKDHGEVRHELDGLEGTLPDVGDAVEGRIDAERRRALRRMHTAQHVVSRVLLDEYGAGTAGNQIHVDRSRIDFEPADFDDEDVARIEELANEAIARDHPVTKEERPRPEVEAETDEGRSLLHLIPESVDPLRVVEIEDYDLCPCGGTHVDRLGEIGGIEITDRTSKGKDTVRLEFVLADA